MKIGRLEIKASRWPWQDYGWFKNSKGTGWAPLNATMGRFGGGWHLALGFRQGGRTLMFDLLFGVITFSWLKKDE